MIRGASITKHGLLSDALSSDIRGGRYKVGDRLPSEPDLSLRFGVSRHTVRTALRTLHELGLVTSQQGVGTLVKQSKPLIQYSHAFNSALDLLQYATKTKVSIIDRSEVVIDEQMAQVFGCKPGEHWWRLRTVRSEPSGQITVAYSEIYIPLAFGAVLNEANRSGQPIFTLIEKRFGQTITEILQEITCVTAVDTETAHHLKIPSASPAMQITRKYLGPNKRVLEVARSLHPNEVFKYAMRLQLHQSLPMSI